MFSPSTTWPNVIKQIDFPPCSAILCWLLPMTCAHVAQGSILLCLPSRAGIKMHAAVPDCWRGCWGYELCHSWLAGEALSLLIHGLNSMSSISFLPYDLHTLHIYVFFCFLSDPLSYKVWSFYVLCLFSPLTSMGMQEAAPASLPLSWL